MVNQYVLLKNCFSDVEASLIAASLEAHEIKYKREDFGSMTYLSHIDRKPQGVDILVRVEDLQKASMLINDQENVTYNHRTYMSVMIKIIIFIIALPGFIALLMEWLK